MSLNTQRTLLLLFLLLQALFIAGYLEHSRARIEDDAGRILRNTALLEVAQFNANMGSMRYLLEDTGDALLLTHTVSPEDAGTFLDQKVKKKDWLDAAIVFDAQGNFVAKASAFPLEQALSASTLASGTFRNHPLFKDLRLSGINEKIFAWHGNGRDPAYGGFAVYRAIRDPEGRYQGGVVGLLNARTLEREFLRMQQQGFKLGPGGSVSVVDHDDGKVLAYMSDNSENRALFLNSYSTHTRAFANDTANQTHSYVSSIDGVHRLGVFLNINDRKWVLAVGLAYRDFLGGWYWQAMISVAAFFAMAALQWLLLHYVRDSFLQRERLGREALTDPLTGLSNRRHFDEWAHGACSLARRYQQPLCVLSLDLDFFKKINDSYGHDGGDAVLKHMARTLRDLLRKSDIMARFGGEEFVAALPMTPLDEAQQVAERIRASIAAQEVTFKDQVIRITVSIGVAQITPDELKVTDGIHTALARADQALYQSKQEGRNRVSVDPAPQALHAQREYC